LNIADEIERLRRLHETGVMSGDEFARAKDALLKNAQAGAQPPAAAAEVRERQVRQWAMFLHLSLLAGFIVPLAGLIVPIVIWQVKKTDLPELDVHGKIVVNWIISLIIYAAVSAVLIIVVIGVPLLVALGILAVVFPILGGIKASNGETWRYPLSIGFLS
jgi:uncharacterized Tic20 family protein